MQTRTSDSVIGGRHRLVALLAEGGMGVTFRAWDLKQGRPVVVKRPRFPGIQVGSLEYAERVSRFGREVQAMRGLPHDHVVPIIDSGVDEFGVPFAVMPFLPGGSLSDTRRKGEGTPYQPCHPSSLHLWLPAIADALDYIHSQGVLHRDVKPSNIFFDGFSNAFLGDFGIAKAISGELHPGEGNALTATNLSIGTPEYMAPETCAPNSSPDGRSDQYALAISVYEMLAGKRPFNGSTAHLVIEHATRPIPPLNGVALRLPKTLIAAVERGLSKSPSDRFPSCRDLARTALAEVAPRPVDLSQAKLLCPNCRTVLRVPRSADGGQGTCPSCRERLEIAKDFSTLWISGEQNRVKAEPSPHTFKSTAASGTARPFAATASSPETVTGYGSGLSAQLTRRSALLVVLCLACLATGVVLMGPIQPGKEGRSVASLDPSSSTSVDGTDGHVGSGVTLAEAAGSIIPQGKDADTAGEERSKSSDEPDASQLIASDDAHEKVSEKAVRGEASSEGDSSNDSFTGIINSLGMRLVHVPSGKFLMSPDRPGGKRHAVVIAEPYYIGATEVTHEQFMAVMGQSHSPSDWEDVFPEVSVTWQEANEFCRKLSESEAENLAGRVYRLPTEAEWEYACRAGSDTDYFFGNEPSEMTRYAWFGESLGQPAHAVAGKMPNMFGLYDTYGSASEWCSDRILPRNSDLKDVRVVRGGSWLHEIDHLSSSARWGMTEVQRGPGNGFRVVMETGHGLRPARELATMPRDIFDLIIQECDGTWDESRPCVVSEIGGMITVDMSHTQYPKFPAVEETQGKPVAHAVEVRNSIGMKFKRISPGSFLMGSSEPETRLFSMSPRKVTLTRSFYMGMHEVTRGNWRDVMGLPQGGGVDEDYPVNFANWFKAEQFCKKLSEKKQEREAGRRYRLPTEAEWEYACRAGTTSTYSFGDDRSKLRDYANFEGGSIFDFGRTVGEYKPNQWGLFDMHGNMWEWCSDWFEDRSSDDVVDPIGPRQGQGRVVRGGGHNSNEWECISASRRAQLPKTNDGDVGFRVVLELANDVDDQAESGKPR